MNYKLKYFLPLHFIVTTCFFYIVLLNQRSYDVWILDGIVIPTAIFIFFSLVAEMFVRENKKLVIFAAFFLAAMNLVPGLKYQFFDGVFDAPGHYRFTNQLALLGHVPEGEFYSETYGGNPGMHIFMACFSIISGISVNEIFRFIIPMLSSLIPLITYFITKNMVDGNVQRCAIIASSFPIVIQYIISGTTLALVPYYLFIGVFVRYVFAKMKKRVFFLIFITLGFTLIISHGVTALFTSLLLMGSLLIFSSFKRIRKKRLGFFPVSAIIVPCLLYVILLWTWWMNVSNLNLNSLANLVTTMLEPTIPAIPTRFYEIPLLSQLQVLVVSHMANGVIGMLSLSGLFIFLRKIRRNELSRKTEGFYLYIIAILGVPTLFLLIQFIVSFGVLQYSRFVTYGMPLCAFLVALTLGRLDKMLSNISKVTIKNLTFGSLLFILVSACLIQFYPCQPLIPRSNVLSRELPENEYLVCTQLVNTLYQIEMIAFAERYSSKGRIASDEVTLTQMYGFSNPSLFSRNIWFSPLIPTTGQDLEWDLFLLHTLEAGPLGEPPEYRTREKIENLRLQAGNVVYDNGESFIISHIPETNNVIYLMPTD